ncbi:MAG TPA: ABC-F family ATP-binding cassette domain-containing protein [Solirubrobacterales bacterium]|jgi:ATPase subunit of ABC transporter with duplicated ATPase domains
MPSVFLDAQGVSRSFGARILLEGIELQVHDGDRIAVVGRNGSGKSTLLRILADEEIADGGTVARHGSVAYLPQLVTTPSLSARQAILERIGVAAATRELDRQAEALEAGDLSAIDVHAAALDRWLALGGEDAAARLAGAAAELGLAPELLDRPLSHLSGGQASRAGLAAVRIARCDVLLLDEPTNHLDADGLARLRALLREHTGAVVLVSHDRALLADFADSIVELDEGEATRYSGGWEVFQRERADARVRASREYDRAVTERDRLAAVDREIRRRATASATRVDSRRAPDGDKHGKEHVRSRADGMRRRAARLSSRREQVEVPDKPIEPAGLSLELSAAERRGGAALTLEGAELRRGDWRVGPLDLTVSYGDRLRLAGPNGAGKSTVLAALEGTLALAAGRRRAARGAVVATLGQDREAMGGAHTATAVLRAATDLNETDARTALAAFGLSAEEVERPASTLSPGERTRAELALAAHRRATCLLLDEPTNHLDIESLEVLEAAVVDWPGALVVATHDATFAAALRLDQEVELAPPRSADPSP